MNLKTRLLKLLGQPEVRVTYVQHDATELRLDDWRKNPNLTEAARRLFQDKTYKLLRQMLDNENPCHNVLALGVSPNDRIVHQARIEGYAMSLNNLDAATKAILTKGSLVATFEPEVQPNKK
jgi:hypothetical protein